MSRRISIATAAALAFVAIGVGLAFYAPARGAIYHLRSAVGLEPARLASADEMCADTADNGSEIYFVSCGGFF